MVVEKLRESLNLPIGGVKKNMGRTDLFKHRCRSAFASFFYWWACLAVSLDGISSTRTKCGMILQFAAAFSVVLMRRVLHFA